MKKRIIELFNNNKNTIFALFVIETIVLVVALLITTLGSAVVGSILLFTVGVVLLCIATWFIREIFFEEGDEWNV